ncbi:MULTISPECIES: hypothetical protein [unclassified Microbulbifer]|uniref:hypothetical protein n=1 Tax=unclassified Microbulbifer TaxID=2619833 RepID=UPI0027E489B9|nr:MULTISPECIES: hypothetical protein [unclassified Microbulbifer]
MCEIIDALKSAGINYIFHSSRVTNIGKIADSGVIISAATLGRITPGSRKDIRSGGGAYVYFRYVQNVCATKFNSFGTRCSLDNNIHFVMPVEKLADYNWFISSIDLNGKLPKGVGSGVIDMPSDKKIGVINSIQNYPNDKNGEMGIHDCVQLCDFSHIVLSAKNYRKYKKDYLSLISSANDMKKCAGETSRLKVVIGSNSEISSVRLANSSGIIQ